MNHHDFDTLVDAAKRSGFRGIEVPAGAFDSDEAACCASNKMSDMGLRFGLIVAPADMYKIDDVEFDAKLLQFGQWAHRAKLAGCHRAYNHIWPGSNRYTYDRNFEWHVHRLAKIYHVLHEEGIQYGLEFMGATSVCRQFQYPFIRSLMGIVDLADAVSSEIGFVFDTIHWYTSGSREDDLWYALHHVQRAVNLHLSCADASCSREDQDDHIRAMPGENDTIDCVSILRLFDVAGYDGPVIIEPMEPTTKRYASMSAFEAASDAIACIRRLFYLAGIQDG
mgnify:CR=1 FL=1